MAQKKFIIGIGGFSGNLLVLAVEKRLRNNFPGEPYEIYLPPHSPDSEARRNSVETAYTLAKEKGTFSFSLPDEFQQLEIQALYTFLCNPQIHVALVVSTGNARWSLGKGVQSHFEALALLIERAGPLRDNIAESKFYPSVGRFGMQHLGQGGSTKEQVETGQKIVIRGAIEGWLAYSRRYEGIAHQLDIRV